MYCVKCRRKVHIERLVKVTLKNKREAWKGKCPHCGTDVYRITGIRKPLYKKVGGRRKR